MLSISCLECLGNLVKAGAVRIAAVSMLYTCFGLDSAGEVVKMEQVPAPVRRVAVFAGEKEGAEAMKTLADIGWKRERFNADHRGWANLSSALGNYDIVLVPSTEAVDGAGADEAELMLLRSRAEALQGFMEKGGLVVATGIGDAVALDGVLVQDGKPAVEIVHTASAPPKGGIHVELNSSLMIYPEKVVYGAQIPGHFNIKGSTAQWEVAGRRSDNKLAVLIRRYGRGALVLSTAPLGDAAFLGNASKLLELQRMGVGYVSLAFTYADEKELGHGRGRTLLTLRNTSGTNVAVRGSVKIAGKDNSRTYWGIGEQKTPRSVFSVSMPGVVDLSGEVSCEIFIESMEEGGHRALVQRFSATLPAFMDIDPPTYRGMVSTERRDPDVHFGIKVNPVLDLVEGMTVEVAILDGKGAEIAKREVAVAGDGRISVAMPLPADAPAGEYTIVAKAMRQGLFEETAAATFKVVPVRPGQMFVDQDGVLLDEGKPFFPLGLYHVAAGEFEAAAKTGVNMIQLWNWDASSTNLARIRDLGIRVIYEDQFWGEIVNRGGSSPDPYNFETNKTLHARLAQLRDDPSRSIAMWYTADEPSVGSVPDIKRMRDMWHDLDEDHPTYIVSTGDPRIGEAADVLGVDIYPVYYKNRSPLTGVGDAMANARAHMGGRKPVIAVLQSFGDNPRHGEKPEEVRAMSYLAVTHGVRGVFWYCWKETGDRTGFEGAGHHPATIKTLTDVIAEFKVLAPALMEPGVRMMKSSDGRIHAIMCGSEATGRFLVYVNGEYDPAESTLAVPELDGMELEPLFGGAAGTVKGGKLQMKLPPLATGAFKITAN